METVGEILERVCPCGGDPTGPQHQESLLHREWLLGQGVRNGMHDPVADFRDKRRISDLAPDAFPHDLR